jgi:hypothetical protein
MTCSALPLPDRKEVSDSATKAALDNQLNPPVLTNFRHSIELQMVK